MKSIILLKKLEAKPVFTVQDIERIANCSKSYTWQIIARLKERGLIKEVRRNAYTLMDDAYAVATNIVYPCYISFWSASRFLGYTEQLPRVINVATTRKAKALEFEGYKIKFVPIRHFFGYKKIRSGNAEIFLAEDEKLLIDAFLKPKECGNMDEIEKMFENAKISEEKLVSYLKRVNSRAVIKRVGFTLEKMRGIDISAHFKMDNNYIPLNPFTMQGKKTNAQWRLRI